MEEKTSIEKVRLIEGHVESLVREAISCEVSKDKIYELVSVYWKKEQERIFANVELLTKEEARIKEILTLPVEELIKKAISQKITKSNVKYYITKFWNKALLILESDDLNAELAQFNIFEISCFKLIVLTINNKISKEQLLEAIDNNWNRIYRIEMLPSESEEEKEYKKKIQKYVQADYGLFWFINSLDYTRAYTPPFVTEKIGSYKLYHWIQNNTLTNSVPKGMYWVILEEKYKPVIPVKTSFAEEVLWAIKYLYPLGTSETASPEKIVKQANKRMNKIYSRWDENIKEDIRKMIKLMRLYVHEVTASEECQIALDCMPNPNATYFDKAIARVLWEIEHN